MPTLGGGCAVRFMFRLSIWLTAAFIALAPAVSNATVAVFVTTNATNIKVECIGAGGGGANGSDQNGGGGGEYRVIASQAYSSGANFAVTIGAQGTGGAAGGHGVTNPGTNGGDANWNSGA